MADNQSGMIEFHWLMDMLESVEVGLVVLDMDYQVSVWNGFMENNSGITASSIKEKNLFEFFPDLPEQWLKRKVETVRLLKTRAFTTWEQRPYLFHFGNTRPITGTSPYMYQNLTISPLTGSDGVVQLVCLMIYDVTDIAASRQALERANKQLTMMSEIDGLTRLLNRVTWEKQLANEFERIRRYGNNAALVMFDIDHFKRVNDTYGHVAGDEVIRHTARTLTDSMRQADLAGRYGGEEFGMILPETDVEGAVALCERIRTEIENAEVVTSDGTIRYTISMGVAPMVTGIEHYLDWLKQADAALYTAKESGRNQVRVFDGSASVE
ncbi:GGDEF domain-containing protein [Marinobacter sp. 1Y8]